MNLNKRIVLLLLIIIAIVVLLIALLLPFKNKASNLDFVIIDANNNNQFEVNESLDFLLNDTISFKNRKMVWEFGNGDSIASSSNIKYSYKKAGKYLVTLTLEGKYQVPKYIDVIKVTRNTAIDSIPKIYGVDTGYVNEQLVFSCNSPGVDSWYWEFGESGTIDAYDSQVIYTYKNPGVYLIKLKTNRSKYPVYHKIEIFPMFQKLNSEPIDSLSIVEKDIKEKLQAIADAGVKNQTAYYRNLKHIKNNYTCTDDVVVVINGDMYNDLYSYCQGLHYLEGRGSKSVTINEVEVDTIHCIKKIEVTQSIIKE